MSDKTFAEASEELHKALADVRRDFVAAVPPRVIDLFWRGARISARFTPRWPAWVRAVLGTFALLSGILTSNTPGGEGLGLACALWGLWLTMGALGELG